VHLVLLVVSLIHQQERSLRFDPMSGLDAEQLDELMELVSDLLKEPRDKGSGRPRGVTGQVLVIGRGAFMPGRVSRGGLW